MWVFLTLARQSIVSNLPFMLDDPLSAAANFRRSGPSISDLLDEVRAAADGAQGADETGMVRARLARDGFPGQLWVAPDWQSRLRPEQFGDAVTQACRAAADDRARRLSHAMAEDDWLYQVEAAARETGPRRPPREPDLAQQRRAARAANPRRPEAVLDDMMATFAEVDRFLDAPPSPPPAGTGSDPHGALTVTVTESGLESCSVRAEWLDGQRAGFLTEAFGRALAAARADLDERRSAPRPDGVANPRRLQEHLENLVEEAWRLMWLFPRPGEG
jgi:hypothetical protein